MATGYSARLPRSCGRRLGCLRCWLWASQRASFITCSIEAFIECRTLKCARQRLVFLTSERDFASAVREFLFRQPTPRLLLFVRRKEFHWRPTHSRARKGERKSLPT